MTNRKRDSINPKHYILPGGVQVIDVVEAFRLEPHIHDAVIYLLRAGEKLEPEDKGDSVKAEIRDLEKAIWWLQRRVQLLKGETPQLLVSKQHTTYSPKESGGHSK